MPKLCKDGSLCSKPACSDADECFKPDVLNVWHCLLCRMPKVVLGSYDGPNRCDFCGWDERYECKRQVWNRVTQAFEDAPWPDE